MKLLGRKTNMDTIKGTRWVVMVMFFIGWWFALPVAVSFAQPDIRGDYDSGSLTRTSCENPADNGEFGFAIRVNIIDQVGPEFTCFFRARTAAIDAEISTGECSGTVTDEGQISGMFTYETRVFGMFDASGTGVFDGQVIGNTMVVNFSGQDQVGDTCAFTGQFSATRP